MTISVRDATTKIRLAVNSLIEMSGSIACKSVRKLFSSCDATEKLKPAIVVDYQVVAKENVQK